MREVYIFNMGKVTVEKRNFTNDTGVIVPYNVICIRGTLNGKEESIEKSVSRTEAMLIGMLLESDEDLTITSGGKSQDIEVTRKSGN